MLTMFKSFEAPPSAKKTTAALLFSHLFIALPGKPSSLMNWQVIHNHDA